MPGCADAAEEGRSGSWVCDLGSRGSVLPGAALGNKGAVVGAGAGLGDGVWGEEGGLDEGVSGVGVDEKSESKWFCGYLMGRRALVTAFSTEWPMCPLMAPKEGGERLAEESGDD
jgi:hypothetical protein